MSAVSRHPEVRDAMLPVQRAAAFRGDVVMVGRDIGTVILPDATLKVYLTADPPRCVPPAARPRWARRSASTSTWRRFAAATRPTRSARWRRCAFPAGALILDTGELDVDACVEAIVAAPGARSMRSWFFHPGAIIAGFLARLLFDARVEGVEHVPREGPFIIVSNHCSNVDPPLIGWATGHQIGRIVHFMAKIEMRGWPIIGWLATQSAVYFVRRGEGDRAAQRFSLEALAGRSPDRHLRRGHALA